MTNNYKLELLRLHKEYTKSSKQNIFPIEESGSNRKYFRIEDESHKSIIGVVGTSIKENIAFIEISKIFEEQGINAPKVLAASEDNYCYLQTDLGNTTLFSAIESGRESGLFSDFQKNLLIKTIEYLPKIQFLTAPKLDFSICYPQAELDRNNVFFDLNYFKYFFLKTIEIDFDEIALENDFNTLCEVILDNNENQTFIYRDFQSRNVMIKDNEPYFIDFQGGRKGPIYYDVASFVYQAKANFPKELQKELIDKYLDSLKKYMEVDKDIFLEKLRYFVLFRQLQVLGAYGFRGVIQQKKHFLESIPFALKNIKNLMPFVQLPYISELFISNKINFSADINKNRDSDNKKFVVQIESFSYKKEMPKDSSNNGGGYVFDCRSINNPGRYEEYKHLNGKDQKVKDFLMAQDETKQFMNNVFSLVNSHITSFLSRDFNHLSVFFGCTGGQHRSVFFAESLAEHLKSFNITIELKHNEL